MQTKQGAKRQSRNILTMLQTSKLIRLVEERYAGSGMTSEEFAEVATAELGFEVSASNVSGARSALGIESELRRIARERASARATAKSAPVGDDTELRDKVDLLQMRVDRLSAELARLMSELGMKTVSNVEAGRATA